MHGTYEWRVHIFSLSLSHSVKTETCILKHFQVSFILHRFINRLNEPETMISIISSKKKKKKGCVQGKEFGKRQIPLASWLISSVLNNLDHKLTRQRESC